MAILGGLSYCRHKLQNVQVTWHGYCATFLSGTTRARATATVYTPADGNPFLHCAWSGPLECALVFACGVDRGPVRREYPVGFVLTTHA